MVDFARMQGATAVLRGIRAISDYEHEFQMALMNRRLAPEIETVFLQPRGATRVVSSRMVKEVFSFGGDVTGLVPPNVLKRLRARSARGSLSALCLVLASELCGARRPPDSRLGGQRYNFLRLQEFTD